MKVLHFSTWNEACGIAAYTGNLVSALTELGLTNEIHAVNASARKYWTRGEVQADLDAFCARAADFDIVHIQHEFSFFARGDLRRSIVLLRRVLKRLSSLGKPVVVTFHTHPPFRPSLVHLIEKNHAGLPWFVKQALLVRNMVLSRQWRWHVGRFFHGAGRSATALVHTKTTRRALIEDGHFAPTAVAVIPMGVVKRKDSLTGVSRAEARARLGLPPDAIVASMFGFVQPFKGYEVAIRALTRLPKHWHLAIVGGPHPEGGSDKTLNMILRLRSSLRLSSRVTVTGFADFETLDLYHAATDMCLAPYKHGDLISGSAGVTWALSSGKPLIASNIPVFKEIHEDAACLLLFAEEATYDLAWQMERLAADPALQQSLVEKATAYTNGHMWPEVAKTVANIYEKALARA